MKIGELEVRNTADIINPNTRLCGLVFAAGGFGKTTFGATLDKMTKKFMNKPTVFIAVEAGEGGGTMSIQDFGVDYVIPSSIDDMERVIAGLSSDTTYGGVVLDSCTEYVKRFVQPYALKFPSRERLETRNAGVPERSDYQTMGEKLRQQINRLINLTVHPDLNIRKHLLVTALEREKTDKDGNPIYIQPDLPGAMASTAVAMFQTVMSIGLRAKVVQDPVTKKTGRVLERVLLCQGDGIRQVKDRTNMFPNNGPVDLAEIWERHWLPRLEERTRKAA